MLQSLNASWTSSKITGRNTIRSFRETSLGMSLDDIFPSRNEPQPPAPLPHSEGSFSRVRSVNQVRTIVDVETTNLSQRQRKWELGEDEMRSDTHSRHRRLREPKPSLADVVLLNSSAPQDPDLARLARQESPPSDKIRLPTISEILSSDVDQMGTIGVSSILNPEDTLTARQRNLDSAETTTTWNISVKSSISEDLSRDDKDRGAKLRYLQKRHERQTGFAQVTRRDGWSEV